MAIDGFKIRILGAPSLRAVDGLDFLPQEKRIRKGRQTGETYFVYHTEFEGIKIKESPQATIVQGSLHKYHNRGFHNWNQFTYSMLKESILSLCDRLQVKPDQCILENLEFGINLQFPIDVDKFLDTNVITWLLKSSEYKKDFDSNGLYIQYGKGQYYIKSYNKGKQHQRSTEILRVEKKLMKAEQIKRHGIVTLKDLFDKSKLESLCYDLYESYSHLIIVDDIYFIGFADDDERECFRIGLNPKYWPSLSRTRRSRFKTKFLDLIDRYNLDTYKTLIMDAIIDTSIRLIHNDNPHYPKQIKINTMKRFDRPAENRVNKHSATF